MSCPDLDRLIDLYHGLSDPELEGHVGACPSCQADLEAILWIPALCETGVDLPDRWVERVLETLPFAEGRIERSRESLGQRVVTGLLGSVTAAFALQVSGSSGAGGPALLLILSLTVGLISGIVRFPPGIWAEMGEV